MAPSPSKGKGIHKSSGKIFRKKDQESNRGSTGSIHGSSGSNGSNSNGSSSSSSSSGNGSSRKDDGSSYTLVSSSSTIDLKDCPLGLPVLNAIDHTRYLPRFSNLCTGDSLSMEELDNLQLELELLASSCLVMKSTVTSELSVIEQLEKGKIVPRATVSPGKRLKQDVEQKPLKKAKDNSGKAREVSHTPAPAPQVPVTPPASKAPKVKCSIVKNEPLFDVPDLPTTEAPKPPPPPRNDIINRFWAMVDTYCQEITADDIKLLEDMIAARNDDPDIYKIQPLGKHYTLRWAQEDLMDEQKEGSKLADGSTTANGSPSKKKDVPDKLLRELDMNNCGGGSTGDDTPSIGPITQRLLAGLVEEKSILQADNAENKAALGVSRPGFLRSLGLGSGAGLEKRLRKELQEQGIMELDNPGQEDDDEILGELKKCQSELRAVSAHNHLQLSRLLQLAREALYRHDLKKKLRDAEAKVIEAYKNLSSLRIKKKQPTKKDKEAAWKAIKDRELIIRQLDSLGS